MNGRTKLDILTTYRTQMNLAVFPIAPTCPFQFQTIRTVLACLNALKNGPRQRLDKNGRLFPKSGAPGC